MATVPASSGSPPPGGDGFDPDAKPPLLNRLLPIVAIVVVAAAAWWLYGQITATGTVKVDNEPPAIKAEMLPPPPPPPPPPPDQPPPDKLPDPNPAPAPEPAPAPDQPAPMKIDGPAQAGTDAFGMSAGKGGGMGAVGGNGTCTGLNCGGGGAPIATGFYTRYLSGALQDRIQDNDKINRQIFTADFSVWISASGQVTRAELLRSSGNGKRDQMLLAILQSVRGLDAPPAAFRFPQKITVRGSRGF